MMGHSAEHDFEQAFSAAWPTSKWTGMTLLVACSGGADSVALLRCMAKLAPNSTTLKVAHYNHQLRGDDSDGDEQFVCSLANNLGLQCDVGKTNSDASPKSLSSEENLRLTRYKFLEQSASRLGARYIVTAHTADDQAETIVHRLSRGAGAAGLRGIPAFRCMGPDLVLARPMLDIWRSDVIAFLEAIGQSFRVDTSNQSDHYTRNRIRNNILPALESVHPSAKRNIVEASKNVGELYSFIEAEAGAFLDRWLTVSAEGSVLPLMRLREIHTALQKEALRNIWLKSNWPIADMTTEHWTLLSELISTQSLEATSKLTSQSFPGNVLVRIDANQISLKRI